MKAKLEIIIQEEESLQKVKLLVRCPGGGFLDWYGVLTFDNNKA